MKEDDDTQQIREVIATWLRASAADDLDTVLSLMAEDVVFLLPGRPPMRGRAAYAEASRSLVKCESRWWARPRTTRAGR
jgi:uncharacterized protein (TIGR02246 family)